MDNSYISYLHHTLGLEHVILPERSARIEFQAIGANAIAPAEREMLDKIISALKLSANAFSVSEGTEMHESASPMVVVFTDDAIGRGAWTPVGASQVLKTFSLASMLKDPTLKKECWAHLQTIKLNQTFGTESLGYSLYV